MKSRLTAVVVLIGIVIVGGFLIRSISAKRKTAEKALKAEEAVAVRVVPVRRGSIERAFTVTGTVEADVLINVVPKVPGKVSAVYVDEGDNVRAGQILARLDNTDLLAQRKQAEAAIAAARARLKQAQTGTGLQATETDTTIATAEAQLATAKARLRQAEAAAEVTITQTQTSVQQAEEALRAAQARLDLVREGARRQEKQQAEEAVRQAKANLDTAEKNLKRAEKLLAEGAMAQQQYDAAKLQYDVAQAQYNTAVQQLDMVREGARSQEVQMAEAQVEQARAALALAKANDAQNRIRQQDVEAAKEAVQQAEAGLRMARASRARNAISKEDVEAARAALNQAQANLSFVNAQISYTVIRAPAAGVIVRRNVDKGEAASPAMPMFIIVNNRNVYLRAKVSETQISDVRLGDTVDVTVDALGDRVFVGKIVEILPAADPEGRVFEAKISLPNPEGLLKQGMFARARVVSEAQNDVLLVPREAVQRIDDKQVVYVVTGGRAEERVVTTGINDETDIVVLSGLSEGQQVIVEGQHLVRPGAKVNVQQRREAAGV